MELNHPVSSARGSFTALAGRETMTTLSIRKANAKCRSSQEERQQLLPGIPDEVTLDQISSKLPWKVFHVLEAVSRAWLHTIRSRQVYDARVLSHSTETLVLLTTKDGMALWSPRDKSRLLLPRLKYSYNHSSFVSFHGKIYLLGTQVHVLDVAGRRQWKKCASMIELRRDFGCAVMHGKIYVFGGFKFRSREFCGSEVYDPQQDLWSPIKPMATKIVFRVETVGEELFVINGYNTVYHDQGWMHVYHPVKDEWRVASSVGRIRNPVGEGRPFVARGKLHSINNVGIYIYNAEDNVWTRLHSFSFSFGPAGTAVYFPRAVLVMGGELFVKLCLCTSRYCSVPCSEIDLVIQSEGFGSEKAKLVWHKAPFPDFPPSLSKLTPILL